MPQVPENFHKLLNVDIHKSWPLSIRTSNVLKNNGIYTVRDLIECSERKLLTFLNLGRRGVEEIKEILKFHSLTLNWNFENSDFEETTHKVAPNETNTKKDIPHKLLTLNILQDWPLSVRTYNALKQENIEYLGDLLQYNINDLLKFRNFGKKSLDEIKENLSENNLHNFNINLSSWEEIKEIHLKNIEIENLNINEKLRSFNKSIFKDFKSFKENYFKLERIKINKELSPLELEKLIIDDIEEILSLINYRMNIFFKGRYGYLEDYKTLETLGKKFGITRERVRQIEKELNLSLKKIGKIDKNSLLEYFSKYEFISFHKLFPQLDKNFTDTARGTGEITRDKLVVFIENYCGVKEEYFKTPERELWHFDTEKLKEIFTFVPSATDYETFLGIIQENYGYNKFVAKSAIDYMQEKDLLKIVNKKIFPVKINKNFEVTHILIDFPEGLHWKKICEIGNKSYTKNKWHLDRLVGDSSLNMASNPNIYLCERGTYKLFKFCPEIKNREKIINFFTNYLKKNNQEQLAMELVYKETIKEKDFNNLNFYNARAIIKKFGEEKGIFHSGKSGTNTIGLKKDLKSISLKDKIKDIIDNIFGEIHYSEIHKKLQKTDENLPLDIRLNDLVDEMYIFRISPGTYLNFEDAIKLCDKKDVKNVLDKLLNKYEFITLGFMREQINEELGYGLSNFYYDSISRILSKENSWFYGSNYLSKKSKKTISADKYIKNSYDNNLSTNENYEIISKKIGISKMYYSNIVYKEKFRFNTDWIHQDD